MYDRLLLLLHIFDERRTLSLRSLSVLLNVNPTAIAADISWLLSKEYLRFEHSYASKHGDVLTLKAPLSITPEGKNALYLEEKSRKNFKFKEVRAWVTLGISIAAFILAIIDLLLK